ncbi:MAG: hypothetical protein EYC70_09245 [Planctomycetota bacterium]|nr:MAG: hypothetical protein EYC70_09245 [Planctomycetota bacterium]
MTPSTPHWTDGAPRRSEIAESEFCAYLAGQTSDFLSTCNGVLESAPEQWSQRQTYRLHRTSSDLETLLDNYGARENRTFLPIRELVALVRWLSLAMTNLLHLDSRLPSYQLVDEAWARNVLAPSIRRSALELGEMIVRTLQGLRENWIAVGLTWTSVVERDDGTHPSGPHPRLRRNRDEQPDASAAHPAAARLASQYLELMRSLEKFCAGPVSGLQPLREFVANYYTEESARSIEARAHNLQSSYDTQIAGTQDEARHVELSRLRGAVSQALHLLEAGTCLVHLYERHDLHGPGGALRAQFERAIVEERLLDVLVTGCVIMACDGLQRGRADAELILRVFTRQTSVDLALPDGVTLHARPISLIVSVVSRHGTSVEMEIQGRKASAASIMQMLMVAGGQPNARSVRFYGDQEVLKDLALLFQHHLGEDGLDRLPAHLNYLKPS